MSYTKKQFIEDVKKEARALRENATKKEISNLDFETLNPSNADHCIYGQMTGNCNSRRATKLITLSCKRQMKNNISSYLPADIAKIRQTVNGKLSLAKFRQQRGFLTNYISPISPLESYIASKYARNANLIAYLKGETNDLNL